MRALQVLDVKGFMAKLLMQETFDELLVSELVVQTFARFEIDGKLNNEYYNSDELEQLQGRTNAKWEELRPMIFSIIKGKKTPLSFQIHLILTNSQTQKLMEQYQITSEDREQAELYFHIKFSKNDLYVISGVSRAKFSLDKSIEHAWDDKLEHYMKQLGIAVSEP